MQCFHAKNITASLSAAVHAGTCSCTGNTKKHMLYTYAFPYMSSLPVMETHPRFPMCSGPKMETHTRFHVILLFFGRNTCVLPICKGNTFKVSLKIGIIIVEVETHFIHIAYVHATGCFECGNTCRFHEFYTLWWETHACFHDFSDFGLKTHACLCAETHVRCRIHALHSFGKLLLLRSRVFCRCHVVSETKLPLSIEKLSWQASIKISHKKTNLWLCNFCTLMLSFLTYVVITPHLML